jgi:16S rRNA processing protein RimM
VETGGRGRVLRLAGIDSRAAAEALHERYLEADPLPLPEGTYYWHEIIGLDVRDPAGGSLGTVTDVFRAGENEVYVVTDADGHEQLVPALRSVVQAIDLDGGSMVIDYHSEEVG